MIEQKQQFALLKMLFFAVVLACVSSKDDPRLLLTYTTTSTRTANVGVYCAGVTRTSLVSASAKATASDYNAQIAAMTTLTGSSLISNALHGNINTAITSLTSSPPIQLFIFIGIFLIGFVIFQFIWPCLGCCCCCPSCCPSKCCQKEEQEQYTKCELYWPVIFLVLAAGLAIGASAYGFTQAGAFASDINGVGCSLSILIDDILNGNVTNDNSSFFTGLNTLVGSLGTVQSNINTINSSLDNLTTAPGSNMTAIINQANSALNNIDLISSGTSDTPLTLTYLSPLNSNTASVSLASTFPTVLGTKTGGGLVKQMYTGIQGVKTVLNSISTAAQGFQSSSSSFGGAITTASNAINGFATTLTQADNTFGTNLNTVSSPSQSITLGVQAFFGAIIGISVLILLGAFVMCCCAKPNCRYLMYFMCFLLFFITLISFLIATIFSLIVPVLYFGCDFLNIGLNSSAGFSANFGSFINNVTIQGYITACLPSGNGDIISAIGGLTALNNLGTTVTSIGSFNASSITSALTTAVTAIETQILNFALSKTMDITDSAQLAILTNIANPSQYASCQSASTVFAADSWVPSTTQTTPIAVTCNAASGTLATDTQCSSSAIFTAASGGCSGCMDTMKIFITNSSSVGVLSALTSRYSPAGCTIFNNDLSNVWQNFYRIKINTFATNSAGVSTGSGVVSRFNTAKNSVTTLVGLINTNITALFANTNSILNASLSAITDPTFGLVAGLNCTLFGQDIVRVTDSICVNVFNTTYFLRLIIGIIAFALLFVHCCVVCSGVRFYKHSERKDRVQDGFPPLEESMSKFRK